jgi:hypothetical protein
MRINIDIDQKRILAECMSKNRDRSVVVATIFNLPTQHFTLQGTKNHIHFS